jgi:hypothetical protein
MKILLIAPKHPDLPSVDAEIATISKFHDVQRVIGDVRDIDIQRVIKEGPFDVIWFATHGGDEGMLLSSSTLSPEGVGQYVSASGARLCVLNTCESEGVANQIIAGGEADMVFTISKDIGDEDALRFSALFAGELANTDDFEDAFKIAAGPGATKYRYLEAKQALRGLAMQATDETSKLRDRVEGLTQNQFELKVNLQALTDRFNQMVQQTMLNQQQAVQAQSSVEKTAELDRRFAERKSSSSSNGGSLTPTFWAIVGIGILIVFLVIYYMGNMAP